MKLFLARLRNRWIRLRLRNRRLDSAARTNLKALDHLDLSRPAKSYRYVLVDVETTGVDLQNLVVDTEKLCREIIFLPFLIPSRAARYQTDYSLNAIADHFGIEIQDRHTAMGDVHTDRIAIHPSVFIRDP